MQYLTIVLVLVFGALVSGELTEFINLRYEVRGVYKNEDETLGIKFISREGALHIRTLNDTTLTYFNSAREINKRKARSIYVLDSEYLQHQDDSDGHLDGPKDKDTMPFDDAMKELFQMEEVYLLDDAAHAIGAKGLTGINTPAVMPFFIFALKITQTLYSESQLYNDTVVEIAEEPVVRQKRGWGWVKKKVTQTVKQLRPSCYKYLRSWPLCTGLCGPFCTCWSFICGNCCFNQGCYDHDICCGRYDQRCYFPRGFSCSSYSC